MNQQWNEMVTIQLLRIQNFHCFSQVDFLTINIFDDHNLEFIYTYLFISILSCTYYFGDNVGD